jgi:hypothetical protein
MRCRIQTLSELTTSPEFSRGHKIIWFGLQGGERFLCGGPGVSALRGAGSEL